MYAIRSYYALHKDIVEVSIFAKSKNNILEGEITKIVKRYRPTFVGTIIKSDTFAFCSVDNKLMPYDIFIPVITSYSIHYTKLYEELIMEFEKEFNIAIPDEEAEKIATVQDAISYIEEHSK